MLERIVLGSCLLGAIACSSDGESGDLAGGPVWFEGATLIVGDDGSPIENSAFLVEDGRFAWVGVRGENQPPTDATRVDLTGQTVIPALIDGHSHIGFTDQRDGTTRRDSFTREMIVDHLQRYA